MGQDFLAQLCIGRRLLCLWRAASRSSWKVRARGQASRRASAMATKLDAWEDKPTPFAVR